MGYKTEINYILKCSTPAESQALHQRLQTGERITVTKSGLRTFVLDSPIMLADHNWKIVGMCKVEQSLVNQNETKLLATILTVFTKEESQIVSRLIQEAEKVK